MYVGCGFLFVSCVTSVIGNQRYIRTANLSFWRRKSRTKVITDFLLGQHRTKKRRFQNFKESIFMVKKINKSNLMRFRCEKNKQIKKHLCSSLLFFSPLTNNDRQTMNRPSNSIGKKWITTYIPNMFKL